MRMMNEIIEIVNETEIEIGVIGTVMGGMDIEIGILDTVMNGTDLGTETEKGTGIEVTMRGGGMMIERDEMIETIGIIVAMTETEIERGTEKGDTGIYPLDMPRLHLLDHL